MIRDRLTRPAMVVWPVALCGALLIGLSACRPVAPERASVNDGAHGKEYVPLYRAPGDSRESRGTVRGDFQWAADAPTLEEAALRWQSYLDKHNPPGQEYEDSFHASYVKAAQYELVRVYFLLGRRDDGDALLRQLDPVGWER